MPSHFYVCDLLPSIIYFTVIVLIIKDMHGVAQFTFVLGLFVNLQKVTISVNKSVCWHGNIWYQLDGFLWSVTLEYFWKFHKENSSFIKIWQEWQVLYMKTYKFMISYGIILIKRNISDKSFRKDQNTHFKFNNFFPKNHTIYEMWKNMVEWEGAQTTT